MKVKELMDALGGFDAQAPVRAAMFDGATTDTEDVAEVAEVDGAAHLNINILSPGVSLVPEGECSRTRHRLSLTPAMRERLEAMDKDLVGTPDYMGLTRFWHESYCGQLDGAGYCVRQCVHDAFVHKGLGLDQASEEHLEVVSLALKKSL